MSRAASHKTLSELVGGIRVGDVLGAGLEGRQRELQVEGAQRMTVVS